MDAQAAEQTLDGPIADTPVSRLLAWVMPWMRGRKPAWLMRLGLLLNDNPGDARDADDLAKRFGTDLTARGAEWLDAHQYARTPEDIAWRRSKLGLRMSAAQEGALEDSFTRQEAAA